MPVPSGFGFRMGVGGGGLMVRYVSRNGWGVMLGIAYDCKPYMSQYHPPMWFGFKRFTSRSGNLFRVWFVYPLSLSVITAGEG